MNKSFFTSILVLSSFYSQAQDTISLQDIYQIPEQNILAQFVVEFDGMSAQQIKLSVENWSSLFFANPNVVTISNTIETIVFEPILVGSYNAGFGVVDEFKVTCNTLFEFKDGKARVTIMERPSRYVSQSGVIRTIMKDYFTMGITEFRSKGIYAPYYRRMTEGKLLVDDYVTQIKNIKTVITQTNDW
jgi:hypothetical protein